MKAESLPIAKVFSNGGDVHFRLPYFQREYAWDKLNWQTLLDDLLDLYEIYDKENPPEHFMGSLVVINEGTVSGTVPVFKLVDGQQRLTTISLILCALTEIIKDKHPDLHSKIRKYITNPDETGEIKYKLLPTTKYQDRRDYLTVIEGNYSHIGSNGSRILPAYQFYLDEFTTRLNDETLEINQLFLTIINCLQVVFIDLNAGEKPYQIFESLNAKGKPLTQADLVRNYIAMKLPVERQREVFEEHWSIVEELLQEKRLVGKSRLGELTAFLRHYLAFRNGILGNEEHVYARFRDRIETIFKTPEQFEQEIQTLKRFAIYYDKLLRPTKENDKDIKFALERLESLEISTGYPFLLALYDAYDSRIIDKNQLLEALKIIENYLVRRYITGEPTNYLNKVFPTLWRDIDVNNFIPSLKEALLLRGYPADYAINQKGLTRRLYDKSGSTRTKTAFVLESINRHLSTSQGQGGYTVLDGDPTIEHILPQTPSEQWKADLGENFNIIYDQYLNTIGNLTLVTQGWNNELSNLPFSQKQSRLASHALVLNKEYFQQSIPIWNDVAIQNRASFLLSKMLEIWPAIGDIPAPKSNSSKPFRVVFLGQSMSVTSWRDVGEKTVNAVMQIVDNFEEIVPSLPYFLSDEPFPRAHRRLEGGWYMNTNLGGASIKRYCQTLIKNSGLELDDWVVEER